MKNNLSFFLFLIAFKCVAAEHAHEFMIFIPDGSTNHNDNSRSASQTHAGSPSQQQDSFLGGSGDRRSVIGHNAAIAGHLLNINEKLDRIGRLISQQNMQRENSGDWRSRSNTPISQHHGMLEQHSHLEEITPSRLDRANSGEKRDRPIFISNQVTDLAIVVKDIQEIKEFLGVGHGENDGQTATPSIPLLHQTGAAATALAMHPLATSSRNNSVAQVQRENIMLYLKSILRRVDAIDDNTTKREKCISCTNFINLIIALGTLFGGMGALFWGAF